VHGRSSRQKKNSLFNRTCRIIDLNLKVIGSLQGRIVSGQHGSSAKENVSFSRTDFRFWLSRIVWGRGACKPVRAAQLVETALQTRRGALAANGALVAVTGARTGRSPKDKFTVDDAVTHELVDWGKVNKPFCAGEV
jgi:hypothetical protein